MKTPAAPTGGYSPLFLTTRWSGVVSAQGKGSRDAIVALEALCRAYWYPLYAYVRRLGRSAHMDWLGVKISKPSFNQKRKASEKVGCCVVVVVGVATARFYKTRGHFVV